MAPQVDLFVCFTKSEWKCDVVFCTVRPPALKWSVTKTKDKFLISWSYPEIPADWAITINYTECDTLKVRTTKKAKKKCYME